MTATSAALDGIGLLIVFYFSFSFVPFKFSQLYNTHYPLVISSGCFALSLPRRHQQRSAPNVLRLCRNMTGRSVDLPFVVICHSLSSGVVFAASSRRSPFEANEDKSKGTNGFCSKTRKAYLIAVGSPKNFPFGFVTIAW